VTAAVRQILVQNLVIDGCRVVSATGLNGRYYSLKNYLSYPQRLGGLRGRRKGKENSEIKSKIST
jgi:hypothetical protein